MAMIVMIIVEDDGDGGEAGHWRSIFPRTSLVINKFSSKGVQDHATYLPGWVCKYVFGLTPLIFR